MQILSLRLTNFRQHELTELDLGPGLVAVVGPNGSGKSTLLEAIAWALYGTAAARGTRDTIKRRGAPARAKVEVELSFSLDTHRYRLTRTLTNAELEQDGQVIANSTGAVTERVVALLGMSREEFFSTYFTGQKELAVMAAMTPAERGRFLSRVLGHEQLRLAQDRLRADRSTRRAELAGLEQGLADPDALESAAHAAAAELADTRSARDAAQALIDAADAELRLCTPEWDAARARRSAWQGLDGERRVIEARVAAARAAFQSIDRDLAAAIDAGHRLATLAPSLAEWPALTAERAVLDQVAVQVTLRSQSIARRDALSARQNVVTLERDRLPKIDAVVAARDVLASAAASRVEAEARHGERYTRWTQDEQEAKTKLEQYRDRFRELREQHHAIVEAGPDGVCPFCARPLGADHDRTIALLAAQMEEVQASGNYYRQRVDQLAAPPEELVGFEERRVAAERLVQTATERLATIEGQHARWIELAREQEDLVSRLEALTRELAGTRLDYDAARHETLRERLAALEPIRRQHDELAGLAGRATALVADAAVREQQTTAAEHALGELDRRIVELAWDPGAFTALEQRVEAARAKAEGARLTLATAAARVETALALRDAAVARQTERRSKASIARRIAAEVELLSELDRAFGELRVHLNQELRPELQARAADHLQALTDGRYTDIEITEEYAAAIVEGDEVKPVISGGEEDVLNLALRLAISEMIAERAGQPLSLLVLDEIFGSLDEDRRQAVVDLLRALGDRFPQVIVITHVEGLRDAFDRIIRVSHDVARGVTQVRDDAPEPLGVAV